MDDINVTITDYATEWKRAIKGSFAQEVARARVEWPRVTSFTIDLRYLLNNTLFKQVVSAPETAMAHIKDALVWNNVLGIDRSEYDRLQVRFSNMPRITAIRHLRADDVGTLVSVEGIVRRVSEVKPKISVAAFRCKSCGNTCFARQRPASVKVDPPDVCSSCGKPAGFVLQDSGHEFVDSQVLTIQEPHESLRPGEAPESIDVVVIGDIAGRVNAGERVTITGIPRTSPASKTNPIFDLYLEGLHIETGHRDIEDLVISDSELATIRELASSPDIYARLAASIAPTIYGHNTVKLAIALQLFGGVRKTVAGTNLRGDIHILMIGDPSVAKSQLLQAAVSLSPRGILASGKSSTAAGLTATAVRDDSKLGGGKWVLEAGALVLADGGLAAVDELDKMSDTDRAALHQALEQQVISINKAGINTVLKTRCSLLAAANPKLGRFDDYSTLSEQFDLPPTLLSRFDLIFVMRDVPTKDADTSIATHILKTHSASADSVVPPIPKDLVVKYTAYARKECFPALTEGASEVLRDYYLRLRTSSGTDGSVPATARQLEALIRLSEAAARVRLSPDVTREDAILVTHIVDESLKQSAFDKVSGTFDIDRIASKTTKSQRDRVAVLTAIIRDLSSETGVASLPSVISEAINRGLSDAEIQDGLETMRNNCLVIEPGRNKTIKLV